MNPLAPVTNTDFGRGVTPVVAPGSLSANGDVGDAAAGDTVVVDAAVEVERKRPALFHGQPQAHQQSALGFVFGVLELRAAVHHAVIVGNHHVARTESDLDATLIGDLIEDLHEFDLTL